MTKPRWDKKVPAEFSVQERSVLVEKLNKRYKIKHYSAWRKQFTHGEKNQLLQAHGFTKVTFGTPFVRGESTRDLVQKVFDHHNIESARRVVVVLGDKWNTRAGWKRTVQVFYQ